MRKTLVTFGLLVAATAAMLPSVSTAATRSTFIVVLDNARADVARDAATLAASVNGQVGFVYTHALKGFSITASDSAAQALANNPRVAYVERDQVVSLDAQDVPTGVRRIFADSNAGIDIDGVDDFRVDVDIAVIDTGVDLQHPDLNVVEGVDCTGGGPFGGSCQPGGDDNHYHGTHVAGTIGALDNGIGVVGVAPGATIHPVKVLNQRGSGYTSWIVAGIDWVAGEASTIEVANMSLGGSGYSQAEYDAIQGAVNAGVAFAVAAGNDNADASKYSPAAFNNVLTVSALADFDGVPDGLGSQTCRSDEDDTLANFSNWGSSVDIAAPGVCILSTYPIEQGSYGTISGTSMASPHVAGALALLASTKNPSNASDVDALYNAVKNAGSLNWTDDSGDGIHEPLLDVSKSTFTPTLVSVGGTGGGGNTDPTIAINSPVDGQSYTLGYPIVLTATANSDATVSWTANGTGITSPWTPPTDGPYQVTATATNLNGTATDTVTITVSTPTTPTYITNSQNNGKTWTAEIRRSDGTSFTGAWSDGGGTCSGTVCSYSGISKKISSVTFTPGDAAPITILKP